MTDNFDEGFCADPEYRRRYMEALISQIEEDRKELDFLWERFRKGLVHGAEIDEIVRLLSWVKEGLETLRKLRDDTLEGILWAELTHAERDILDKEMSIRIFLFSLFKETEYCHLR